MLESSADSTLDVRHCCSAESAWKRSEPMQIWPAFTARRKWRSFNLVKVGILVVVAADVAAVAYLVISRMPWMRLIWLVLGAYAFGFGADLAFAIWLPWEMCRVFTAPTQ